MKIPLIQITMLTFFVIGFIFSSFIEYWIHRFMRLSAKFDKRHRDHHRQNKEQGVLWEFFDYLKGSFIFMLVMFFISLPAGIGWLVGCLSYAAFASYAHQIQHDNPSLCFWMKMPVHYVHHHYNQWEYNFGLGVDWWDRIFKTYKYIDNVNYPECDSSQEGYLQIRWW